MKTEPYFRQIGVQRELIVSKILAQAPARRVSPLPRFRNRSKVVVAAGVVAAHIILLALGVGLFPHLSPPVQEPDKVIEVFEVSETPKALPPETTPPPEVIPPPDPTTLAIPVDPKTPVDANATGIPESASTSSEPDYVPQFKLSALPEISEREFRSRVVYPPLAAQQGIEATVIVTILTDATGKIRQVSVLKDPGYGFAEAVVKALEGMTIRPAEMNGVPVASKIRKSIPFRLK